MVPPKESAAMATGDSSTPTPPVSEIYVYYPYSAPLNPAAGAGQWGEPILVDANGDPIKCPPAYTTQIDPQTGKPVVILLEGAGGKPATVTGDDGAITLATPPTYTPPADQEIHVYCQFIGEVGVPGGEWGEPILVDADGDPIKCPPAFMVEIDPATGQPRLDSLTGQPVVHLLEGDEQKVVDVAPPPYIPSWENLQVYWPLSSPSMGAGAGAPEWGDPIVLDADGNPVPFPPPLHIEIGDDGKPIAYVNHPWDNALSQVPDYTPPSDVVYVYYPFDGGLLGSGGSGAGGWGEPILVDSNGDPIEYPPYFTMETDPETGKPVVVLLEGPGGSVATVTGDDGKVSPVTPPTYVPPGTPPPSEEEAEEAEEELPPGELLETEPGEPVGEAEAVPIVEGVTAEGGEGVPEAGTAGEVPEPEPPPSEPSEGIDVTGVVAEAIPPAAELIAEGVEVAGVVGLAPEEIAAIPVPAAERVEVAGVVGLAAEEIAVSPVPQLVPEPVQVAGVVGLVAEEIAVSPVPQPVPEPVRVAGVVGLAAEEIADLPGPLPEPSVELTGVVGLVAEEIAVSPVPQPVPEPTGATAVVAYQAEAIVIVPASPTIDASGTLGGMAQVVAPVPQLTPELVQVAGIIEGEEEEQNSSSPPAADEERDPYDTEEQA